MFKILILSNFFILIFGYICAQQDTIANKKTTELFGNIFPSFYSTYAKNKRTYNSFDIYTAQIGVKISLNTNVKGIVLYNVTKTTSDITVFDSLNKPLQVVYFKGSEYTAFLKQAEVQWKPTQHWEFSIGQILSEQYLTVQDKFWGYRYIAFTLQERYQFGYPADFGIRSAYNLDKWRFSVTISNGEGPFYKQDSNGLLQYATNIEFRPNNHWITKWYGNLYPNKNTLKSCQTAFIGYKTDKWRLGTEGVIVFNDLWKDANDYIGISAYFSYLLTKPWSIIARQDYIHKNSTLTKTYFTIVGIQYEPTKDFQISLNQRLFSNKQTTYWQSYLSVGFKF
ncbi:MAG: hypothetical protein N2449_07765 [Bacteroidales bacterium]|nr:hypothetical protein [Bacteroidales bacterium]